jgi:hypothetical protein
VSEPQDWPVEIVTIHGDLFSWSPCDPTNRSKLMLKVNGRPVLKLTGWHAVALAVVLFAAASFFGAPSHPPAEVAYSEFINLVKEQGPAVVSRIRISSDRFDFLLNGVPSFTRPVKAHPLLLFFLDKYNVPFYAGSPGGATMVTFLLLNILPFAWIFFSMGMGRKFYGDMTGSVGKNAQEGDFDRSLTFDEVAGKPERAMRLGILW